MALQNVIAVDNGKVLGVNTEKIATTNTPGIVQPDGTSIGIEDGVISVVSANDIGNSVLLTSYTTIETAFTCHSDGYLEVYGTSLGSNAVKICGASNSHKITCIVPADTVISVFVRKGMRIYCTSAFGNNIYFSPLE